jgi:hypothetical protein
MPTEDEKKKKPAGFDLNATPEGFANLGSATMMPGSASPASPAATAGQKAISEAAAVANDPQMRDAFLEEQRLSSESQKEQNRALKARNESDPNVRRMEQREKNKKNREDANAAEAQRRADFWNQGKADERPEVREAREARAKDFQDRQTAQQQRVNDRLKPVRDAAVAQQAADKKRQADMADPRRRMADLQVRAIRDGVKLNYGEVRQEDGKRGIAMAAGPRGQAGYDNTRGAKNLEQTRSMAGIAQSQNAGRMTPQMPQQAGTPVGAMQATKAMAAATPAPSVPDFVSPTFKPPQITQAPRATMAATPTDPNAAAAIASFNESVANQSRPLAPNQQANIRNLQQGNIPTLANIPGDLARQATGSVQNFLQEGMQQRPNRLRNAILGIQSVATGKTPLVAGNKPSAPRPAYQATTPSGAPMTTTVKPESISPTRTPVPRMTAQTAEQKKKNPLLVN